MKLSLSLLATTSYCAPEKKKHQKLQNDRSDGLTPLLPCETTLSDMFGYPGGWYVVNGQTDQSGQVIFDTYVDMVNCYVDIGPRCGANGVQIEIIHMELEADAGNYNHVTGDYDVYDGCWDTIHFEWLNKDGETVERTDPQCGCVAENHPSKTHSVQFCRY